jgi:hypothetical protein
MLSLEFSDAMLAPQIEEAVISLEEKVREANHEVVALFVKPQTAKTFQDQRERALDQASPPQRIPSEPPGPEAGGVWEIVRSRPVDLCIPAPRRDI